MSIRAQGIHKRRPKNSAYFGMSYQRECVFFYITRTVTKVSYIEGKIHGEPIGRINSAINNPIPPTVRPTVKGRQHWDAYPLSRTFIHVNSSRPIKESLKTGPHCAPYNPRTITVKFPPINTTRIRQNAPTKARTRRGAPSSKVTHQSIPRPVLSINLPKRPPTHHLGSLQIATYIGSLNLAREWLIIRR